MEKPTCKSPAINQLVTAYCFGDLTEPQLSEFEAHLLECAYCWPQVEMLSAAVHVLRTDPDLKAEVLDLAMRLKLDPTNFP